MFFHSEVLLTIMSSISEQAHLCEMSVVVILFKILLKTEKPFPRNYMRLLALLLKAGESRYKSGPIRERGMNLN